MAVTAMVRGTDNNQHKIGSKDKVSMATAMETAAMSAATTAACALLTAPGIGADKMAFATTMGGLLVLAVMVVWEVVCAGCVCAASPCCFVRLTHISEPKKWQTTTYWGLPERYQ
jgi:hypothetical protein